ncbi:S24 family peptidase [Mannheimia haemolytica]|nr:S24 family peptidase [Mannheimia haemolytica]
MIKGMTLPEIRRKKLTEWFNTRDIPEKEKSYISQLKSGKSSFGERAARRLENEYGMPSFYLDYDEETESAIVSAMSIQETQSHQYPIHLIDFKAKAGETGFINTNYPEIIQSIYFSLDGLLEIVGRKSSNGIEMITIPTDSMSPTINKGDVVFIDTTINYYNNEGVYIFLLGRKEVKMNNKRIKPEQFADFITQRTGRNLTCPICNSQEHYLHDGYDTFTELCGEKIIGVPTIPYRIEPSPDEVMKFAAPEFHSLHFNEREGTKYWLDQKARTAVIVTCVCCNNMLFFDRERILEWIKGSQNE